MADQFENRKKIEKLGLGPKACNFKKIAADILVSSINECVTNEKYRKNALKISQELQNSKGLELTIELVENELKNKTGN